MAKKERKYWATSMVLARTFGIDYRQNDLVVNLKTGKVLIRAKACMKYGLDEQTALVLRAYDLKDQRTLRMEAWKDEIGALPHHLVPSDNGQRNMVAWDVNGARAWGRRLKTKRSLRLKIRNVIQLGSRQRMLEMEPVVDMAELVRTGELVIN